MLSCIFLSLSLSYSTLLCATKINKLTLSPFYLETVLPKLTNSLGLFSIFQVTASNSFTKYFTATLSSYHFFQPPVKFPQLLQPGPKANAIGSTLLVVFVLVSVGVFLHDYSRRPREQAATCKTSYGLSLELEPVMWPKSRSRGKEMHSGGPLVELRVMRE